MFSYDFVSYNTIIRMNTQNAIGRIDIDHKNRFELSNCYIGECHDLFISGGKGQTVQILYCISVNRYLRSTLINK